MSEHTLAQQIEHTLDDLASRDNAQVAQNIVELVTEHQATRAGIDQVTPTAGDLSSAAHTAFMLRIFMYLVAVQPNKILVVDLERVKALTSDHSLDVKLDGATFTAQAMQHRLDSKGRLI